MKLDGIHHVTATTRDARSNVEFYAGVLGLRLVKKTVNQDDPTVYHLFYGDEDGSPGADITFFEYPDAPRGRAGAGMVHTIVWRVASEDALAFWVERLEARGVGSERIGDRLVLADPEGLRHELRTTVTQDPPLVAEHHARAIG
ncbi:MAG: VOC family protein [Gaiellales bacterium]